MKHAMIFGMGNIGSVLIEQLQKEPIKKSVLVRYVVRSTGIFDLEMNKIAEQNDWKKYIDEVDIAFICIPTVEKGERAFEYEMAFLEKGKPVITCEKASVAYCFNFLKKYKDIFGYTASVGGGTKMLQEISKYKPEDIHKIKAVVNGTLNYISDGLLAGKSKDELVVEVLEKGFAEPGASFFDEVIQGEMRDVVLKTIIIANHSGMFNHDVEEKDIDVIGFKDGKRCVIHITKDKIQCGFSEENTASWLPCGVNNILYINGEQKVCGGGAGAEATVSSMMDDYVTLIAHKI